ncbi:hypothetical protein P3T36_006666 [Kitasatospora sp. MAP12-15]|uniref:NEW3 domain-containing protein n=2 Tax=Kitasatospora TaxID=2063 RepID=UPI00247D2855|nr:hypothetical protein [Kitasatospora sp. MAP12-44]
MKKAWAALLAAAMTAAPLAVVTAAATPAAALDNGLAKTPPMGWNDWNTFGCNVSEKLVEQIADTMVASGMQQAGYQYVNIDDCWMSKSRDAAGNLVPDPVKFPDGITGVAAYVHSKGLKLGIYESAGTMTCAGYPGSLGHEDADAASFASWGVDYLKYDNCNNQNIPGQQRYQAMGAALAKTGRPIVYSLCNWGNENVASWGAGVGNLWRTTGDISADFGSMLGNFHTNVALAAGAGPGAWNDPDMLEVGNGMTPIEDQSEFSLWAAMAAPLISGADLRTATPQTMAIYTNRDVIAVDQDPLGKQGVEIANSGGLDVLAKPLADGSVAVALFNENATTATISTTAQAVGLGAAKGYTLHDLWSKRTTETPGAISAAVPGHGTVLYRVAKTDKPGTFPPSISLDTAIPAQLNGPTAVVTSAFTNNGSSAVGNVTLGLNAPAGWLVKPLTATGFGTVRPGRMAIAAFRITAPTVLTKPIETDTLTGTVKARWSGGDTTGDSPGTVRVAAPVQSPYLTYSDTTAVFGQSGTQLGILGGGADAWGSTDEYSTVYRHGAEHDGSTTIVRVTAQAATSSWAKAGIMVRNDVTAPGSSPGYLILAVTPGNGYVLQWDSTGSGQLDSNSAPSDSGLGAASYPTWLKLVRTGSSYTGSYSTDGTTWTTVGSATVPDVAATQDAGVFMTAHNNGGGTTGEVDFDSLSQN